MSSAVYLRHMNKFEHPKPKVSIIIPCWFREGQDGKYGKNETYWFAQSCLRLLMKRTPYKIDGKLNYELILVNNGSTLDMANWLQEPNKGEMSPDSFWSNADVLIKNKENLGFAPSCNQGFNLARGEYIVCMNDDIIVWPGWLEALIAVFELNLEPQAGVVMPALMKQTRDVHEALAMNEIDLKQNYGKYSPGAEFGSCWMMPKKIMDELKAKDGYVFDENFKLGMGEDRDLWDRVRLLGYETYRCHETRVFHLGNMTIGKVKDRKDFTFANREYLEKKREARKI